MNLTLFAQHGFELSPVEFSSFERFLELFIAYNSHTNLSAIRDEEGIIEKHFIDSLYGADIIQNSKFKIQNNGHVTNKASEMKNKFTPHHPIIRLLDIGSGGGFPGIPLKIVIPELQVTLLDSVGKKVKAMNHFVNELGLTQISAIQERAEVLAKDPNHAKQYDFVVSRATAYITDILTWAVPFLAPGGKVLLYKMPSDEEQKDREKILKKLGLVQEGELEYTLAGKERVIFVFAKK